MNTRICGECGKETKTERGLKCHKTRVHGDAKYQRESWLREKYEEGLQSAEIADICSVSSETIRRWAVKFGFGRSLSDSSRLTVMRDPDHPLRERSGYANFFTHKQGYEISACGVNKEQIKLHRLIAVAEYGFEAVDSKVVHHKSNIPWDNRSENLELMSPAEHTKHHHEHGVGGFRND